MKQITPLTPPLQHPSRTETIARLVKIYGLGLTISADKVRFWVLPDFPVAPLPLEN